MVKIRVTGMATAGVPPPDMTLQLYLDGVLFQSVGFPSVALNAPKDIIAEVTEPGDHSAYATMTLTNIAGTARFTSNTVQFNIAQPAPEITIRIGTSKAEYWTGESIQVTMSVRDQYGVLSGWTARLKDTAGRAYADFPPTDSAGFSVLNVAIIVAGSYQLFAESLQPESGHVSASIALTIKTPPPTEITLTTDKTSLVAGDSVLFTAKLLVNGVLTDPRSVGIQEFLLLSGDIRPYGPVGNMPWGASGAVLGITFPIAGTFTFRAMLWAVTLTPEVKAMLPWQPITTSDVSGIGAGWLAVFTAPVTLAVNAPPKIGTRMAIGIWTSPISQACPPMKNKTVAILTNSAGIPLDGKTVQFWAVPDYKQPSQFLEGSKRGQDTTGPGGRSVLVAVCGIAGPPYVYYDTFIYKSGQALDDTYYPPYTTGSPVSSWVIAYFSGDDTHAPSWAYMHAD